MSVQVIAHRGARNEAPENTLAAFELAIAAGSDMIEFDVQLTKDEQVVVMHDPTIDRMTNRIGRIQELTWERLQEAIVGGPKWPNSTERIPLLEEVLTLGSGRIAVNIELKPTADNHTRLTDRVIDVVRSARFPTDSVLISCFKQDALRYAQQTYPEFQIATVYKVRPDDPLTLPGSFIHPEFRSVDAAFIQAAHALGKRVNVWTLNHPEEWEQAIAMGVDGITTDEPRRLRELLELGRGLATAP